MTPGNATPGDTRRVDSTRSNAIVGHRLPGGRMSVHAPGQPCALCDGTGHVPAPAMSRAAM
jgi:hypothetical protein